MRVRLVNVSARDGIEQLIVGQVGDRFRSQVWNLPNSGRRPAAAISCMTRGAVFYISRWRINGESHSTI